MFFLRRKADAHRELLFKTGGEEKKKEKKKAVNTVGTVWDFLTGEHGWSAGFTGRRGPNKPVLGPRLTPVGRQAARVRAAGGRGGKTVNNHKLHLRQFLWFGFDQCLKWGGGERKWPVLSLYSRGVYISWYERMKKYYIMK